MKKNSSTCQKGILKTTEKTFRGNKTASQQYLVKGNKKQSSGNFTRDFLRISREENAHFDQIKEREVVEYSTTSLEVMIHSQ